ncbi:MAG: squalene--hopene cyclase, partial [Verrucomicrobiota bacterium]
MLLVFLAVSQTSAQNPPVQQRLQDPIPSKVEEIYLKGLNYLVQNQNQEGHWNDNYGSQSGVVGLAVMALLAHGEDPNFGPYRTSIRRGLTFILRQQNKENGYIGPSMYNHGFATTCLAEAYGTVNLPELGPALKKAVDLILSS